MFHMTPISLLLLSLSVTVSFIVIKTLNSARCYTLFYSVSLVLKRMIQVPIHDLLLLLN